MFTASVLPIRRKEALQEMVLLCSRALQLLGAYCKRISTFAHLLSKCLVLHSKTVSTQVSVSVMCKYCDKFRNWDEFSTVPDVHVEQDHRIPVTLISVRFAVCFYFLIF